MKLLETLKRRRDVVVIAATLLAAFVFHWPLPVVFLCNHT